jgi:hypothetical protein
MEAKINTGPIWGIGKPQKGFLGNFFSVSKSTPKIISTPQIITEQCKGIKLGENMVKSIIFSTDMALIENNDSDAVLAVYPFSPSPKIIKALIDFSQRPVICGIGGGLTQGKIAIDMASQAEQLGAAAIIVNQPFKIRDIEIIKRKVSIPLISSISNPEIGVLDRVNAGTDIFHVTGGKNTSAIISEILHIMPKFPLIATAGKTYENLQESINSGAHGIVLIPPSTRELFKPIMEEYRKKIGFWSKIFK